MSGGGTFATTFIASVVEAIEMVTIVVGVGTIRGWRSTLMSLKPLELIRGFGRFWFDFVVGDDWTVAARVGLGLAATYGLVLAPDMPAFWLLPVVVAVLLAGAVWRGVCQINGVDAVALVVSP